MSRLMIRTIFKLTRTSRCFKEPTHVRHCSSTVTSSPATFASLLRSSVYVDMGDPVGKIVKGEVFKVVDGHLYIDFGHKFHCVCAHPSWYKKAVYPGDKVTLQVNDLELSKTFYGEYKAATLLEADCSLLSIQNVAQSSSVPSFLPSDDDSSQFDFPDEDVALNEHLG